MAKITCATCRFWEKETLVPSNTFGKCHFNPPTVERGLTYWPEVYGPSWCGKAEPVEPSTGEEKP